MTIETQESSIIYTGDGTSTAFAVPFPFMAKEDLQISTGTGEPGDEDTYLVLGLDYAVTGEGEDGGTVVLASPLADGLKIAILRRTPQTQTTDYPEGGDFPAQSHEEALDKLTMEVQELRDDLARSPGLQPTAGGTGQQVIVEMAQWYDETKANAASAATDATRAETAAGEAEHSAANAKADADRAAALVDPASLASSVYNVRKPFVVETAVASGSVLPLPGYYYPTRDVLTLYYGGLTCTPRKTGVESSGRYQYEEIGDDPNAVSDQVRVWFDVAVGDVFDMWVVASAAGRNIDEIEQLVVTAQEAATASEGAAISAANDADRAEAAAQTVPDVSTASDGQVPVARDVSGTMVARYEDPPSPSVSEETKALPSDLQAGTPYTVPSYIVGARKLQIYVGGIYYTKGVDADTAQYQENGTSGSVSTSITFFDDQPAGAMITAISAG